MSDKNINEWLLYTTSIKKIHRGNKIKRENEPRKSYSVPEKTTPTTYGIDFSGFGYTETSTNKITLKKKLRKLRSETPIATIDLHGLTLDQAYITLVQFIESCYHNNISRVLVISGKGTFHDGIFQGKIKRNIENWFEFLVSKGYIEHYMTSNNTLGGEGAYKVILKKFKK